MRVISVAKGSYVITLSYPGNELFNSQTVQGPKDTVVVKDLKVALRVMNGHEKHEWLLSSDFFTSNVGSISSHFPYIKG